MSVVQSIGNSWIICRSKTFGGRVYYFNTLTGEAAWNLSKSEIKKAKNATESNFNLNNCLEPKELPQDFFHKPKTPDPNIMHPKIYNKQIINNRFPQQGNILPTQLSHYPIATINPVQFNIPIPASFNPSLWNVSTQPILIASVNQPHHVINNNVSIEEIVPSRTSIPLSSRFQNFKEVNARQPQQKRVLNRRFNNRYNHVAFKNRNSNEKPYIHKKDLRLLLSSKRRNCTAQGNRNVHHNEEAGTSMQTPLKKSSYVINTTIEDDKDNEERSFKYLDTTNLKTILQVNAIDLWYVIMDSNILLNHVDFLCALLKADSQCRLIILRSVMNKIHNATKTRFRTLAYNSACFISEKLDEKLAILVEENTEENVQGKYEIIDCCMKFFNQGVHVLVLTEDIELHCYDIRIPIYTLTELLKILNTRTPETKSKSPELLSSPSRSIKITIPNDTSTVNYKKDVENNQESNTCHQTTIDNEKELLLESPYKEDLEEKITDDLGVQDDTVEVPKIDKNVEDKSTNTFITNKLVNDILSDSSVKSESQSIESKKHITWNKRRYKHREMSEEASECSSENSHYCESNSSSNHDENNVSLDEISNPAVRTKVFQTNVIEQAESVPSEEKSNVMQCNLEPNQLECLNTVSDKDTRGTSITVDDTSTALHTESIKNTLNEQDSVNDKTKKKEICEDNNVMFEVTSEAMEEYLRMKCDEWISRFVQIMEEALTQVLQTDPPFILEMMPPPWNIYEGAQCVKMKFSSDCDVIDASNKLSNILFESGALRGQIKIDLNPNKYMEMYSYGVYLIDALQGVLNDNEDLQIAAESLAKLLNDIEDPHLDQTSQDSFADTENQIAVIQEKVCNENPESVSKTTTNSDTNSNIYNLRSHRSNNKQENEESITPGQVTFIRNVDLESSFFTSLDLKKKISENKIEVDRKSLGESGSNLITDKTQFDTENESRTIKSTEKNENEAPAVEPKISEPKIIRNFTKCLEFEEKLKNIISKQNDDQVSTIPSETDYGNEELDYEIEDEYYYQNDYDYNEFHEYADEDQFIDEDCTYETDNVSFQTVFYKIEDHVKNEFQSIHEFCENSYAVLSSSHSDVEKSKIKLKAEETYLHLKKLCEELLSIMERETSDSAYRIQNVFTLGENLVDEEDLNSYKSFISKCLEQGNILKEAVELVVESCVK